MRTKKLRFMTKVAFISLFAISLFACSDNDDLTNPPSPNPPTAEENYLHCADNKVRFTSEAVILGTSGKDADKINASLKQLLTNISSTVTDKTQLLIVPALTAQYEKEITTVYNNGGIIAVTHPTDSQLDTWFKIHNWDDKMLACGPNGALMFSFAKDYHCCVTTTVNNDEVLADKKDIALMPDKNNEDFIFASDPSQKDDVKEEQVEGNKNLGEEVITDFEDHSHDDMFTSLNSWVQIMNRDIQERDDLAKRNSAVLANFNSQMSRAGETPSDVSQIFKCYSYNTSANFSGSLFVRKLLGSSPDSIHGNGSVGVSFDIYQIHCYEGEGNDKASDYYLVNMNTFLENGNMYKGKWWNKHGGCRVRICGMYAKEFKTEFMPWNTEKKQPYSLDEVETIGIPSPATTNGQTTYTKSSSFSVNAGLSVSGSASAKPAGPEVSANIGAKLGLGWSWTNSETRTISDMSIANTSGLYNYNGKQVSKVGYNLIFNNLPVFDWSYERGFNEGDAQMYRSTATFTGSWIWHKKDVPDDSNEAPIGIKVRTRATYEAQSFITTKADLKSYSIDTLANIDEVIKLRPFCRLRCGSIIFTNNFKNDTAIKSVVIKQIVDGKEVQIWESKNTLIPGKSVTSDALPIAKKYKIFFTTTNGKRYQYTTYPEKEILQEIGNPVYAATDFSPIP